MARTQARAFIGCFIAGGLLVGRIPSQPVARVHEKRPSGLYRPVQINGLPTSCSFPLSTPRTHSPVVPGRAKDFFPRTRPWFDLPFRAGITCPSGARPTAMEKTDKAATEVETSHPAREPSPAERRWEAKVLKPALEKSPEPEQEFTTISGVPVERL